MELKLPPEQMELYRRVDEILWKDWDPIGVSGFPEARDEYYSYLPNAFRLTLEGSGKSKIAEYLFSIEAERMGLPGNKQKCMRIAGMLLKAKDDLGL
jgi:hypothetical protein